MLIQEWGEDEYITENTSVYENLFPGKIWDASSTLKIQSPMIIEGRNDGTNDFGDEFRLQAFVVDEFNISEFPSSLSASEQALWINGDVRASVFYGLIASSETGYEYTIPVLGIAYSSTASQDTQLAITQVGSMDTGESLKELWFQRAFNQINGAEATSGDWEYWYVECPDSSQIPQANTPGGTCEQRRLKCGGEYDSNMRLIVATYKIIVGTAGTACMVGVILLGSFCLTGNLLACGSVSTLGTYCINVLGAASVTFLVTSAGAGLAYETCMDGCFSRNGCP